MATKLTFLCVVLALTGCKALDKKIIQESAAPMPLLQRSGRDSVAPPSASIELLPSAQITLQWMYDDLSIIDGFHIYCGQLSHEYSDQMITVGPVLQGTVPDLVPNQPYYFAVTAFDDFGDESDFSPELEADAPQLLLLTFPEAGALQASTDLVNWQARAGQLANGSWTVRFHPDQPAEFFRVAP
jgi:hypothetical protein